MKLKVLSKIESEGKQKKMCRLDELFIYRKLNERNKELSGEILRLYDIACEYLSMIPQGLFSGYTNHDISHSLKIIGYMGQLMKIEKNSNMFSDYDLYYALASALLHDVGMVVSENDIKEYLAGRRSDFNVENLMAFSDSGSELEQETEKRKLLTVYIRKNHGKRSAEFIMQNASSWGISDRKARVIADICKSHCMALDTAIDEHLSQLNEPIRPVRGIITSPRYIALLLRIADALDIDSSRASDIIRDVRGIDERPENRTHWDTNAVVESTSLVSGRDYFDAPNNDSLSVLVNITEFEIFKDHLRERVGNVDNAILKAAYYDILSDVNRYFSMVKRQLCEAKEKSIDIAYGHNNGATYPQYFIDISTNIKFTPKPNYTSHTVNMDYKTVLVNLLGSELYGDRRIGLREIVQNSIDAIKWRYRQREELRRRIRDENQILIYINIDSDNPQNDYVSIADNGIGMDRGTITDCLLGVGKSIYNTEDFRVSSSQFQHIGYYGIGFFSVFMLCDSVTINSKKQGENLISVTINDINSNFFSEMISPEPQDSFPYGWASGTEIVLHGISRFKEAFTKLQVSGRPDISEQCYGEHVKHYLELLFLNDENCEIVFEVSENNVKTTSANISEITEEGYKAECQINKLNDGRGTTIRNDNVEMCVEYATDLSYSSILQWDERKKTFAKKNNLNSLDLGGKKSVDACICSITDWKTNKQVLLYVPPKYDEDPFRLGITDYRQLVLYNGQPIWGTYSLSDLSKSVNIQPLIPNKNYCIAVIEKMRLKRIGDTTILYRRNAFFEDHAPLSAVKSGREYLDKIYVRNVLIPYSHICLPWLLVGYNNKFMPLVKKITINVLNKNVVPNIKRDSLSDSDLKKVSSIVAKQLVSILANSENAEAISEKERKEIEEIIEGDIN